MEIKTPEVEERQSLLTHLDELFIRLRYIIYWIVAGMVAAYSLSSPMVSALVKPLLHQMPEGTKVVFITPFEKIWVHLRVSFIAGVFFVFPALLWNIGAFVRPALYPHERRKIKWAIFSTSVVFALGVYLGYRYTLPLVMRALINYGSDASTPFLSLSPYVNTALGILLATALLLELPVIQIHLSGWGWVRASTWSKNRKIALVGNAIVSAILSPPDALSMLMMMLPIQVLYECGILGARVAEWTRHEKTS